MLHLRVKVVQWVQAAPHPTLHFNGGKKLVDVQRTPTPCGQGTLAAHLLWHPIRPSGEGSRTCFQDPSSIVKGKRLREIKSIAESHTASRQVQGPRMYILLKGWHIQI